MNVLQGKTVFITGASGGIGEATARKFASAGCRLLLCARRISRLKKLASELSRSEGTDVHAFRLDVTRPADVKKTLSALDKSWCEIDILVNNAGLSRGLNKLYEGDLKDWEEMINTNVKGLLYVTRQVLPGMVKRGSGHVINIGSTAGHEVYPGGNVYCATKFAVGALTKGMKMDLHGTGVRVSSVDPGMTLTGFSLVRFRGDSERADKVYEGMTPLSPEDVAETVLFCAARPSHVNISQVVMIPADQSGYGLVNRKN